MKRLIWGAVLFLMAAGGSTSKVQACDWKTVAKEWAPQTMVVTQGENTIVISSDEDVITVVIYANGPDHSEWM